MTHQLNPPNPEEETTRFLMEDPKELLVLDDNLNSHKPNILIVDDNPYNLQILVNMLSNLGYKARPALDGSLALRSVKQEPPDLILLDILLPGLDGYEVCRQLKADEQTRQIPVIFISALSEVVDKVKAFTAGGVDFITKPFQLEEVVARLRIHLINQNFQRQLAAQNQQLTQEIQRRNEAEQQLRLLARAVSAASSGIAIVDAQNPDHPIIYINSGFEKITGYSQAEILGQNYSILQGKERADLRLSTLFTEGRDCQAIVQNFRKDGSPFWNELTVAPVYNSKGKLSNFVCVLNDISDRKQAESVLLQAKEAADAANRAKSEFLANMSHEIRTPMNAILGLSQLLLEKSTDELTLSYLKSISASGKTLLTLINDILDLSQVEAGKINLNYDPLNLHGLIQEIQYIFQQQADVKNLLLPIEIDDSVPACIQFDEVRLRQILFNLVGNAIKFTEQGQVKISVYCHGQDAIAPSVLDPSASSLPTSVSLTIAISDTGIGIAPEQQSLVFEPFIQSPGQSLRKYGGTGLGLPISRRLTQLLGGTLEVDSALDQGSTFILNFPQVTVMEMTPVQKTPALIDENLNQFQRSKILVVDDVQSNLDLIAGYFAGTQHHLLWAQDGEEAIELVKAYSPDVIFLDLRMPKMDGWEVARILKQEKATQNIPIAIVSASNHSSDEPALRTLCQGFLHKPVTRSQLVEVLKSILPPIAPSEAVKEIEDIENTANLEQIRVERLPELLEKLRTHETTLWPQLAITMKRREVKDFATLLNQWASEHGCQILQAYATRLDNQIQAFDWENLPNTIAQFPEIRVCLERER